MELKHKTMWKNITHLLVLIVPYGIETDNGRIVLLDQLLC